MLRKFKMSGYTHCIFLVTVVMLFTATDAIKIRYLNNLCHDNVVTVNGDLLITLTPWFQATCKITLVPKSGNRLVARFTRYHFDGVKNFIGIIDGHCPYESLQLSTDNTYFFDENDGFCGTFRPTDQYDLGQKGYFKYESTYRAVTTSMKVDLLVTEVFDKQDKCSKDQFDCETKNYCVSEDVTCNGYDDCGNDKDEIQGCGLTVPIIVGIVVGCICFVVLVIVIGICVVKKLRH